MQNNVFIIQLPVNPKLASKDATSKIFQLLPCNILNMATGEQTHSPNTNIAQIRAEDRLVIFLASPDVSVFKLKVPPLSIANLELAAPALLEEALGTSFSNCATLVCHGPAEKDGTTYVSIAVCDKPWIENIKIHFSTSRCKTINIYPLYEVIPRDTSKCSFLINFDSDNSITWRAGTAAGGAQLFAGQDGIESNVYVNSVVKSNQATPEDTLIYSANVSNTWSSKKTTPVKLEILAKNLILKSAENKPVDFYTSKKTNKHKLNIWNIKINKFCILLLMFCTIQISLSIIQYWKLDAKKIALQSELVGKLSNKEPESLPSEKITEKFLKNVLNQLRYADGTSEETSFIFLESVLFELLRNEPEASPIAISYKDSALYVSLPAEVDLKNTSMEYPTIIVSKVKPGHWKLEKQNK